MMVNDETGSQKVCVDELEIRGGGGGQFRCCGGEVEVVVSGDITNNKKLQLHGQ